MKANCVSFIVFVSFWILGVSVLVYGYISVIMSSLTVPLFDPAVNSFEDLVKSKDVAPLLRIDMYFGIRIMVSARYVTVF